MGVTERTSHNPSGGLVVDSSDYDAQSHGESPESSQIQSEKSEQEPKYGWVVVACIFIINAHTWGFTSSYAVFIAYYLNSGKFPGADPLTLAFVAGLSFSTTLLVAPASTFLVPRIGTRRTVMLGIAVETASLIGASFSTQMWHLVLSQGLAFGAGVGLIVNTTVSVVPQWFVARRSFATALTTGGSGIGGLLYSLVSNVMIHRIGLSWTYRVLAILAFTVNGIACIFLKDRNKTLGSVHIAFDFSFFKRLDFCLYLAWGFFFQFGMGITLFSLADFSQTMGFSSSQGSIASAMFNLSQGLGRPLIGLISDRYGRFNVAGISTLIASLSVFALWIPTGRFFAGTIVYALFGAFAGSMWPVIAPVGVEVFGIQRLPSALSIFWPVLVLPTTFAEPIAMSIKQSGIWGYINIQLLCGLMYLASFISIWALRVLQLSQRQAKVMNLDTSDCQTTETTLSDTRDQGKAEAWRNIVKVSKI